LHNNPMKIIEHYVYVFGSPEELINNSGTNIIFLLKRLILLVISTSKLCGKNYIKEISNWIE